MPKPSKEKRLTLTPEQVILNAFDYLKRDRLSLQELLIIGAQSNSPSDKHTQNVLLGLVDQGRLTWSEENGTVWFSIVRKTSDTKLH